MLCLIIRLTSEIPENYKNSKIIVLTFALWGLLTWVGIQTWFYADNFIATPSCCNWFEYFIDGGTISLTFTY